MKKLKRFILALFSSLMLTACGMPAEAFAAEQQTQYTSQNTAAVIEVEDIITDTSVITINVGESWTLQYTILPYNATDKSISISMQSANNLFTVAELNGSVVVTGKNIGTGIISLITNNNKFVSYSITVNPATPEPPAEPLIYDAKAVADYFNLQVAEYGLKIKYNFLFKGYVLKYSFGPSIDDSLENLKSAVYFFRPFFPKYMMNLYAYYLDATSETPAEADIVLVNSNHSTCAILYSMIENEELIATVLIYNNYED